MKAVVFAIVIAATGCEVRNVNRAATVPHMTPTLRNGAPLDAPGELVLGASSVADASIGATDRTAGVEVPGTQLEGALRGRLGRYVTVGLIVAHGLDGTTQAIKANQPAVDGGGPTGRGATITAIVPTSDPHWTVGFDLESLVWSVPWIEYSACVENCGGATASRSSGTSNVGQMALGVVPTYHTDRFSVWGGLTVRNHPTIQQKDVEVGVDSSGDVEGGAPNLVVSAGADVDLGGGVRGGLTLYQVAYGTPVRYAPNLAATLTIPLGTRDHKR